MTDNTNYLQLVAFETVFNTLNALNKAVQAKWSDLNNPVKSWREYRDFYTIRFDAALRSGKSVWLARKAVKNKDCIIALSVGAKQNLSDATAEVYSMPWLKKVDCIPQYRFVFVDMASWYSRKDIKRIYKLFGHPDVTFVFVG